MGERAYVPGASPSSADHRPTVLVIDDNAAHRRATASALQKLSYAVYEADDGALGLERARRVTPDLVLSDIRMSGLDGYGVLTELRQDPGLRDIPVILMTGNADADGFRRGMGLGADDYLAKPFSLRELGTAVRTRLEKHKSIRDRADQKVDEIRAQIAMMLPHELLTPLTAILSLAELLEPSNSAVTMERVQEYGRHIRSAADRLHRLIRNFLIYAQLEVLNSDATKAAALRATPPEQASDTIAREATAVASAAQRADDLILELEPAQLPVSAVVLAKIVHELIGNAFKFSAPGQPVTVRLHKTTSAVELQICDVGRGFNPEYLSNIGAYMQFDRKLYEQQGSGLGLVIAQRLVQLHGGTFQICSELKRGVRITLAFVEQDAAAPRAARTFGQPGPAGDRPTLAPRPPTQN